MYILLEICVTIDTVNLPKAELTLFTSYLTWFAQVKLFLSLSKRSSLLFHPSSIGELVALYSGMKYIGDEEIDLRESNCENNINLDKISRINCATFRYSSPYGFSLDVPEPYSNSYRATSGFKSNHSFRNNAGFVAFDHPRFGFIISIFALRDIDQDEEIFTHYGYQVKSPALDWYFELKEKFEKGLI